MLRRSIAIMLTAAALALTGCSAVADKLPIMKAADPQAKMVQVFGPIEQKIPVADGYAVISPANGGGRDLGYLASDHQSWQVKGKKYPVEADAKVSVDGSLVVVETKKENAPQYAAFKVGPGGLEQADYYTEKAPDPAVKAGPFIQVNKRLNALWYFNDGKLVKAYRVATGRQTQPPAPTWNDYKTNFFTPEGTYRVTNFVLNPPFNALKPGDTSYTGGAPGNPLGTRWMGFGVLDNDNAWVWGIHGTSHPEMIGTWASDGCIRMFTEQAEELFAQIKGRNPTLKIVGA